jgi:hypothetical protein
MSYCRGIIYIYKCADSELRADVFICNSSLHPMGQPFTCYTEAELAAHVTEHLEDAQEIRESVAKVLTRLNEEKG